MRTVCKPLAVMLSFVGVISADTVSAAQIKYIWKGNSGYIDDVSQWYVGTWKGENATKPPSAEDQINFNAPTSAEYSLALTNDLTVTQVNFASSVKATLVVSNKVFNAGKFVVASGNNLVNTTKVDFVCGHILSPTSLMVGNTTERGPGCLKMHDGTVIDVGGGNITVQYASVIELDDACLFGTNLANQTSTFSGNSELRVHGAKTLFKTTGIMGFKSGSSLVFYPPVDAAPFSQAPIQTYKLNSVVSGETNCTLRVDYDTARKCSHRGGGAYLLVKGGVTTASSLNGNFTIFPNVEVPDFVEVIQDAKNAEIWVRIKPPAGTVIIYR